MIGKMAAIVGLIVALHAAGGEIDTSRPARGSGIRMGIFCAVGVTPIKGLNAMGVVGEVPATVKGWATRYDVSGDRKPEILISRHDRAEQAVFLHAFTLTGTESKGFPLKFPGASYCMIEDLNGDRRAEILVVGPDMSLTVHSVTGKKLNGLGVKLHKATFNVVRVGDLNGDGKKEILQSLFLPRRLHAWDFTGRPIPGFPVKIPRWKENVPYGFGFAKINNRSRARHVVIGHTGSGLALVNLRGKFAPGWPVTLDKVHYGWRGVCGDVTGDGIDEIFALLSPQAGSQDYEIQPFDAAGKPLKGWPIPFSVAPVNRNMMGGSFKCQYPLLSFADVDGDGKNEIVWIDSSAFLHVAKADGKELQDENHKGEEAEKENASKEYPGYRGGYPRPVRHGNSQAPITPPMFWDLDRDRASEIIYLVHGADGDGYTLKVFDKAGRERSADFGLTLTLADGLTIHETALADMNGDSWPELLILAAPKPTRRSWQEMNKRKVFGFTLKPQAPRKPR